VGHGSWANLGKFNQIAVKKFPTRWVGLRDGRPIGPQGQSVQGYSRKNFSHEPNFPGDERIQVPPGKSDLSNMTRRGGFGGGCAESTAMKKPQDPKGRPVIPQSREGLQEWGHKNGENNRATASRSFPGTVRPSTSARVTSCAPRSFCRMMFLIVRAKSLP